MSSFLLAQHPRLEVAQLGSVRALRLGQDCHQLLKVSFHRHSAILPDEADGRGSCWQGQDNSPQPAHPDVWQWRAVQEGQQPGHLGSEREAVDLPAEAAQWLFCHLPDHLLGLRWPGGVLYHPPVLSVPAVCLYSEWMGGWVRCSPVSMHSRVDLTGSSLGYISKLNLFYAWVYILFLWLRQDI